MCCNGANKKEGKIKMKKSVKCLLIAISACATSAFAVASSGCDIKQMINELRCDHVLIDGEVTKLPTCTEEGEKIKECTLCTYTETEILESLGHSEVVLSAVAPTCTSTGLTEGRICGVCGELFEAQEIIPTKAHSPIVDEYIAPTCTEEGKKAGSHCKDCNAVLIEQEVISAKGHSSVTDKAVAPTCTSTGLTEGSHCKDCGEVLQAQETLDMLEHVMKEMEGYEATCEKTGFSGGTKCENCDYATDGEIITALGHIWDEGEVTKEATCETDGERSFTCERGCTKTEVILAFGHSLDDGEVTLEPTCTAKGEKLFTCTICAGEIVEELDMIPHDFGEGETTKEVSCLTDGEVVLTCKLCEFTEIQIIPAPGHSYVSGTCTVCNESEAGCFIAGTPVLMADGSIKAIEDVMPGDMVLTWNEETQQYDTGRVLNKILHQTYTIGRVTFADGTVVEVTPGHPIYTENGWKTLDGEEFPLLKVGDKVLSTNGEYDEIVSIEFTTVDEPVNVYNIEVEGEHTFFAGETSILAHNGGSK